jgi:hypothetical protein
MSEAKEIEGTIKRALKMSMWGTPRDKAEMQKRAAEMVLAGKDASEAEPLTLGQIVGRIASVDIREITREDGSVDTIWSGIGEFEGAIYSTSQVVESPSANLPRYYLEGAKALLDKGADAVLVAIEIVLVATGKQIPVAYEVRNLIPREADNPINRMKLALQRSGKLKGLPPPIRLSGETEGTEARTFPDPEPTTSEKASVNKAKAPAA